MANELGQLADKAINDLQYKKEQLQAQVDILAKEANARLDELAKNEMNSPAYNKWVKDGQIRFGVKGKTYQDVQSEFWRTKNFLDAKTSTVQGSQDVLDQISRNTGYYGASGKLTQDEASRFFSLADKIKDYYEMTGQTAKALDYQLIWEQVNTAIANGNRIVNGVETSVKEIEQIAKMESVIDDEIKAIQDDALEALTPPKDIVGYGGFGNRIVGAIANVGKAIGGFFRGLFKR